MIYSGLTIIIASLMVTPVLASTPRPTLEVNVYPIVADSVSSPMKGQEFTLRAAEIAKAAGVELDLRGTNPDDTTLDRVEFSPPEQRDDNSWFLPESDVYRAWKLSATNAVTVLSPGHQLLQSAWVLYQSDTFLYRFAGPHHASASPAFKGLMVGPEGWVLQYMYGRLENDSSGQHMDSVKFHIIRNGTDLGDSLGYENCYSYRHIAGQPFFFYERKGQFGWNYSGIEYAAPINQIYQRGCCDIVNDPRFYDKGFHAYGLRGGTWYLVVGRVR